MTARKQGPVLLRGLGDDHGSRVRDDADAEALNALGREFQPSVVAGQLQGDSLKDRVLRMVCEYHPDDVDELLDLIHARGGRAQHHEVVAVLYSLSKQGGLVTFREGRTGLSRIKATEAGYRLLGYAPPKAEVKHFGGHKGHQYFDSPRPGDPTDFRNHPSVARGGEVTVTRVYPPVVVDEQHVTTDAELRAVRDAQQDPPRSEGGDDIHYPALAALRARVAASADDRRRAEAALQAATDLEAAGLLDEAKHLERLAEGIAAGYSLTPIEAEYLRYAQDAEYAPPTKEDR